MLCKTTAHVVQNGLPSCTAMQVKQEPDASEADAKQDVDQQHHDEELSDSDESEDEDDFEVMPPNTCIEACTSSRKRRLQYAA